MKPFSYPLNQVRRETAGFTRWDASALLAALGLLFLIGCGMSVSHPVKKSKLTECISNTKSISTAFQMWLHDYEDRLPWQTTPTVQDKAILAMAQPARCFLQMSNYLLTPRFLVCPADDRKPASSFATLSNRNVSYFVNDSSTLVMQSREASIPMIGDRFLMRNGTALESGEQNIHLRTDTLEWNPQFHQGKGNISSLDGATSTTDSSGLRRSLSLWLDSGITDLVLQIP